MIRRAVLLISACILGFPLSAQTATPGGQFTIATGYSQAFIAADALGNVYVTSGSPAPTTIYKLTRAANGAYTQTVVPVYLSTNPANPGYGTAVDGSGQLYFSLYNGDVVRYTPSGSTYLGPFTVATHAAQGTNMVYSLAVDAAGNVYIPDASNNRVLKETYSEGTYTQSVIATSALGENFSFPFGIGVDAAGNVYIGDYYSGRIIKETPVGSGYSASLVANNLHAYEIAVDPTGAVYVPDIVTNKVYRETPSGGGYTQTYASSTITSAKNVTADAAGNVYAIGETTVYELAPGFAVIPTASVGSSSTQAVTFTVAASGMLPALSNANVVTGGAPNLDFTLGSGSTCTGVVTAGQTCTITVAFTPTAPGQRMGAVNLLDANSHLLATAYVSGTGIGPLATVTPGIISTIAGNGTKCPDASDVSPTNPCGDGTAAANADATLYFPSGIAVDGIGNVYIGDTTDCRVRKVTAATGIISTIAGTGVDSSSGDNGPANVATVAQPRGVAVDGAGNVYIADSYGQKIRKITAATGIISTVAGNGNGCSNSTAATAPCGDGSAATAANLNSPTSVAVDAFGNLYIADYGDQRVRMVAAATGIISSIAGTGNGSFSGDGGPGTSASLNQPVGVAVDSAGNVYIADASNSRIREVLASTGVINTVAGNGTFSYTASQDTGTTQATATGISYPQGVGVDSAGNVYIADYNNQRIRKVSAATGFISSVAGLGAGALTASENTGSTAATASNLYGPKGAAFDPLGNLYIVEYDDQRVRKVTTTGAITFPTATTAGQPDNADGTRTLLLNNLGNAPLTFSNQAITGGSFILANPSSGGCSVPVSIAGNASCLLGVNFTPQTGQSGAVVGSLTLTDNSLNAINAVQNIPLVGTTVAGSVSLDVGTVSFPAGTPLAYLPFIEGFNGATADIGTLSATVNGGVSGVGNITCTGKPAHRNCSVAYNGSALAIPGTYQILVSVAADTADGYAAASASGTLNVTGSSRRPIADPGGIASPVIGAPVTAGKTGSF